MQWMLRYTLRQLEYLVACSETGSLVAAAARLNVSQPTVSAAIAKLERDIGVQLLIRHHAQGVVPTAHAETLLQFARNLLLQAEDFQQMAAATSETLEGEFRLGSFLSLAPTHLPGLIASLGRTYPGLDLKVREGTQTQLVEGLRQGAHHAALLYDLDLPRDVRRTTLAVVKPHVLLPAAHPLAARKTIALRELVDLPLVLLDVPPSRQYFLGLFRDSGLSPLIGFTSPSIELVRGMVGRGLGYSLLVTRPPGDVTYDGQTLSICDISDEIDASRIVLATLDTIQPTRAMTAFRDFAVAYFAQSVRDRPHH